MDNILGQLLEIIPKNTDVFIVSDHGGQMSPRKTVYFNNYLIEAGLLKIEKKENLLVKLGMSKEKLMKIIQKIGISPKMIPSKVKNIIPAKHPVLVKEATPQGSVYYSGQFAQEHFHGIWVNIQDKEKRKEVISKTIKLLLSIVDESNSQKVVVMAKPKEELFSGPFMDRIPDIVFQTAPSYGGHPSLFNGQKISINKPTPRIGTHSINGVWLAYGPRIAKVKKEASILDICPTILYLFGLKIPKEMDGTVIFEAIKKEVLERNPVQYKEKTKKRSHCKKYVYSKKEEKILKERLKGLGYI
jgi:predicted AlkP superfamily phosphohydrolase/phosphomutase